MNFDIQSIFKLKQEIAVIKISRFENSRSAFSHEQPHNSLAHQLPHHLFLPPLPCPLQPYCDPHVKTRDGQNTATNLPHHRTNVQCAENDPRGWKFVTEGLREGQGSMRREVGKGIRYACHFFPFFTTLLTESHWSHVQHLAAPLRLTFNTRGIFDLPGPPSHRNTRRGVCSSTTTPSTHISMWGGDFQPPQPSLTSKRDDDADSRVSMENTNQNCWQVRVRDLRELQWQTGSQAKQKYVNIYKECVARASVLRKRKQDGSRTEVRLSARRDGVGVDDSGLECPTVAHTRAIARVGR